MRPGFLLLLGCACAQSFVLPMTAWDLSRHGSGQALAAYLGQPGASPAVCDLRSPGPHIWLVDREVGDALMEGLRTRRIEPAQWRGCMDNLLATAAPDGQTALMDAAAASYGELLADWRMEHARVFGEPLAAVHQLFIERPPGSGPQAGAGRELDEHLRRVAGDQSRPVARRYASDLLAARELDRGRLRGRTVDVALLDQLRAAGDLGELRRCAFRLPDVSLRLEARRRAIRVGVERSSFPEVRADADAVERAVMADGFNRIAADAQTPPRAWIDGIAMAGVAVLQSPADGVATLRPQADRAGQRLLPSVPLRGALRVEAAGISRPVTVCGPAEALDPTPCLAPADLGVEGEFAHVDRNGGVHLADRLSSERAVALARTSDRLSLPITLGGRRLVTLEAPLRFERPPELVLSDGDPIRGPDLQVRVERIAGGRVLYVVESGGRAMQVVVEAEDARSFRVVSRGPRGGSGWSGSSGADGSSGSRGWDASCPSSSGADGGRGGDGQRGGDGGDGSPGGAGGDILVEVACQGADCETLGPLAKSNVVSEGGEGGDGGPGGRGGAGGRGGDGGSGATCTDLDGHGTSLSGGSSGLSGSDGFSGSSGSRGPAGRPGRVTVRVLP